MIGQTILHYTILEQLGEGGMGVVFKAQDTKLDRLVALKFLPPHITASEQDKARFVQEAKAASAINHPDICTIYDIQEHEGRQFIVMEFVDGQTLRERKSTLSIKQIVDVGVQVAEGLAASHEQGIVHRDIKPENIMIRKDGIVQIMDFGLAKLRGVSRLTKQGSTIGTVGYTSPEQVQGLDSDHRTDIFSLGVVLYELLSGDSPFKGVHETAITYEIVNVDPVPLSTIRPDIDPELGRIVMECMEKDRDERCQSALEVARDLKRFKRESGRQRLNRVSSSRDAYRPLSGSGERAAVPTIVPPAQELTERKKRFRREHLFLAAAVVFLLAFAGALFVYIRAAWEEVHITRASLLPPEKVTYDSEVGGHLALSPNGLVLAFVGSDSTGKRQLWVRNLSALTALPLPGTDDASYPFWSFDGRSIGFFAEGRLKKVDATGGPPLTICEAVAGRGGTWNQDGIIVFAPNTMTPLHQVSASGGVSSPVTTLDSARHERNHRFPYFLPDGKHFLYVSQTSPGGGGIGEQDAMYVGSLDASVTKILLRGSSSMMYASGYLLYVRQSSLMAQPFDPGSLELKGDAVPIVEQVQFIPAWSKGIFSVSQTGVLVYQASSATNREVLMVDRSGRKLATLPVKVPVYRGVFSRDGKRIVSDHYDVPSRNYDIWVFDISRQVNTRLTFNQATDIVPAWSPDGEYVVYSSVRKAAADIYLKHASGAKKEELNLKPA